MVLFIKEQFVTLNKVLLLLFSHSNTNTFVLREPYLW